MVIEQENVFDTTTGLCTYPFSFDRDILQNDIIPEKNTVDCGLYNRLITVESIISFPFRDADF